MPLPRPVFPELPPRAPLGLPPVNWPESNPYSKAKAELGWRLFFDRRMSADNTIACASCHHPEDAFTDRRERPFGVHGEPGRRNSMSIVNAAYLNNLLWDGRAEHLEAQRGLAVTNPAEMDMNADRFKALLTADPSLRALFDKAFPGVKDPSLPQAAQAIATFERLVVSGNSPYDRFVAGDKNALSAVQQRGLAVFTKQCASCHAPPLFTTGGYARLGAGHAGLDDGRAEITSQPGDVGAFRIPSLRDVARTAPYMHDGSIATLRDVVHFYLLAPQSGKSIDSRAASIQFTGTDAEDLVEFLQALNGEGWQRYRSP